jgi:ribosomal protein L40E
MSETVALPQEKLCPKCGAGLEDKAIACPKCGAQVAKAKPDKIELTTGQKIAAAVLILNGLALIAEAVLTKDANAIRGVRGAIVSMVLGGYLFTGKSAALKWAKFAAIFGGVLYTVLSLAQSDIFSAVAQAFFSLSLIGLLFGRAGKIRLAACCLVILGYFGLEIVGLYMTATRPPAAAPATSNAPKT